MTSKQQIGGLRSKWMAVFLLSSLLPLVLTGGVAARWIGNLVNDTSRARAVSTLEIKKNRLTHYQEQRQAEMDMLTHSTHLFYAQRLQKLETLRDFYGTMVQHHVQEWLRATMFFSAHKSLAKNVASIDWVFRQAGGTHAAIISKEGKRWRTLANETRPELDRLRSQYGFDNVYLISSYGNVVVTAVTESVLGENLKKKPFKNSALGMLFLDAQKGPAFRTFAPYTLLDGTPAAWMGTPIHAKKDGKVVGILVVRFSPEIFNNALRGVDAIDPSVRFQLVGQDRLKTVATGGEAQKSGSSSEGTGAEARVLLHEAMQTADTEGSAENTTTGTDGSPTTSTATPNETRRAGLVRGENGQRMLMAWAPLSLLPVSDATSTPDAATSLWGVIAEQSAADAFSPDKKQDIPFYKKQMDLSGYYDFFLIHPDGEVFYSATRQADFGTNMLNGQYANTRLGKLVQQVLKKRTFGMTDVSPYPPSNNEPAAFMAQPLLYNGTLEMVVALQLPLEKITATMQHRDGLGQEGDAYLVGPDRRMRSDSIRDPENHSVLASFVGEVETHGADSAAVQSALAGKTGLLVGNNFSGAPVFTAFSPLVWGHGVTWALLVETPFSQTAMPLQVVPWSVLLTAVLTLMLCVVLAWMTSGAMRRGIFQCMWPLQRLHDGMLAASSSPSGSGKGDFGMLIRHMEGVAERWRHVIGKLRDSGGHTARCSEELVALMASMASHHRSEEHANERVIGETALKEMASHIQKRAEHVHALEQWVEGAEHQALQGKSVVTNTVAATREIAEKTTAFVEIARQTNLLSMKASIELANEGKAGKKFSAVITDIRKLSERGRILADEVGECSLGTVRAAEHANTALTTLASDVQKIVTLVHGMATTDTAQRKELVRIHTITQQMARRTQDDAGVLDQLVPVIRELSRRVTLLQEDLAFFNLGEETAATMSQRDDVAPLLLEQEKT